MKIVAKLMSTQLEFEVSPDMLVEELKKLVASGFHVGTARLKLIAKGKILVDGKKLSSVDIAADGVVIVIAMKVIRCP